jgi:hypothetical protein
MVNLMVEQLVVLEVGIVIIKDIPTCDRFRKFFLLGP